MEQNIEMEIKCVKDRHRTLRTPPVWHLGASILLLCPLDPWGFCHCRCYCHCPQSLHYHP